MKEQTLSQVDWPSIGADCGKVMYDPWVMYFQEYTYKWLYITLTRMRQSRGQFLEGMQSSNRLPTPHPSFLPQLLPSLLPTTYYLAPITFLVIIFFGYDK
jgi:hypothetical protein